MLLLERDYKNAKKNRKKQMRLFFMQCTGCPSFSQLDLDASKGMGVKIWQYGSKIN